MTTKERKIIEKRIDTLINSINNQYDSEVSASILNLHGGKPNHIGTWELEALLDDLLTIENDAT